MILFLPIMLSLLCHFTFANFEDVPRPGGLLPSTHFQHIGTDDGLSHAETTALLQDSRGFIWIGTKNGLNRYDGRDFTVYHHDPYNSNSLSGNHIRDIIEDSRGDIWIATYGGGFHNSNKRAAVFLSINIMIKIPTLLPAILSIQFSRTVWITIGLVVPHRWGD